ncbi:MAG: response regulator, partial [Paracoccaceae bacterium]
MDRDTVKGDRNFSTALIIDDHPLFCDALSMTLRAISDIQEISTAADLKSAVEKLDDEPQPDLVVLDLNLPDVDGLEGLVRLKNMINAPVVVVSSMADNRMITACIKAGASGFVPKHSKREVFISAIGALKQGHIFVPDGFVLLDDGQMRTPEQGDILARLGTLTNQQARILQLICEGKLNKQIAFDLSIAET